MAGKEHEAIADTAACPARSWVRAKQPAYDNKYLSILARAYEHMYSRTAVDEILELERELMGRMPTCLSTQRSTEACLR
jgi:hypothetical protein